MLVTLCSAHMICQMFIIIGVQKENCSRVPIKFWNKKQYRIIVYQWKCDYVLHS
jgi:hypothetical protein